MVVAGRRQTNPTRRTFLDWILAACSAVTGLALAIPSLLYLWPAARGGASGNTEVNDAGKMVIGGSVMVQVNGKVVIVVRHKNGFRAHSAVCTHLGCLVKWDGAKREFLCPCHAAVFDDNGAVVSGPPPSALPEYSVKTIGERVFVSPA